MAGKYKIKQVPEDFIVKEDSLSDLSEHGEYAVFRMKKTNYTTEDAVLRIAKALGLNRKRFGYAGSKDSKAITWQNISIHGATRQQAAALKLNDIELEFLGHRGIPISLGDLRGNSFEIIVRNIAEKPKRVGRIVNLFGEQRFSVNNVEVGKAILKKDFRRAVELICESSAEDKSRLEEFLAKNKNDYVGALKSMPWKVLTMYIHAFQSRVWNAVAKRYDEEHRDSGRKGDDPLDSARNSTNPNIPLVGFSTEFQDKEIEALCISELEQEWIGQQDFVIRQIPDLTSAGTTRKLYAEIKDLRIGHLEDDELNPGMKKCKVTFSLGKGSYATEAIRAMMEWREKALHDR